VTRLCRFLWVAALFSSLWTVPNASRADTEQSRLETFEASARDFSAGLAAHRRGDLERAQVHYEAALTRDSQFVEAMVNIARLHLAAGELEEARALIDRALIERRDYPPAYAVRGLVELHAGDTGAAVADLAQARMMAPGDPHVLTNLGAAYLARGILDKAREALRAALHQQPDNAAAVLNLALVHDRENDSGRAQFYYLRFMELAALDDPKRDPVSRRIKLLAGMERAGIPSGGASGLDVAKRSRQPKKGEN
jgi:tetratricopeptide (TPR) repeat protein